MSPVTVPAVVRESAWSVIFCGATAVAEATGPHTSAAVRTDVTAARKATRRALSSTFHSRRSPPPRHYP